MVNMKHIIFGFMLFCVSCTVSTKRGEITQKAFAKNSQILDTMQEKVKKLSDRVNELEKNNKLLKDQLTNMKSIH